MLKARPLLGQDFRLLVEKLDGEADQIAEVSVAAGGKRRLVGHVHSCDLDSLCRRVVLLRRLSSGVHGSRRVGVALHIAKLILRPRDRRQQRREVEGRRAERLVARQHEVVCQPPQQEIAVRGADQAKIRAKADQWPVAPQEVAAKRVNRTHRRQRQRRIHGGRGREQGGEPLAHLARGFVREGKCENGVRRH